MTIANRLRGALGVYVVILVAALTWHATTLQRSAQRARSLHSVAATHRLASTAQRSRLDEIDAAARKYGVTRDTGYLAQAREIASGYAADMARIQETAQSLEERAALATVHGRWTRVAAVLSSIDPRAPAAARREWLDTLVAGLDQLRQDQSVLADAAQTTMTRELIAFDAAAERARRELWAIVIAAVVLGILISWLLIRAVSGPLARLTAGTRAVASGDFGHRIETSGEDELSALTRDFNAMADRLGEVERLKRDFVSNVSHDLKTPLSSMQETTEVLLDEIAGPLNDRQRRLLALNLEGGRRLSGMLTKLLDLSRLESGAARNVSVLDLGALVRRAVEHVNAARAIRHDRAIIHVDTGAAPLLVRADAEDIAQLLDNLLENAIKFSPADGAVQVTLAPDREQGDRVVLRVADEGAGVPAEDKARIFDRFHQTENGRRHTTRGVGLGLAICRRIVELHGGTIEVRDNTPRGSVFVVTLPGLLAIGRGAQVDDLAEAWI